MGTKIDNPIVQLGKLRVSMLTLEQWIIEGIEMEICGEKITCDDMRKARRKCIDDMFKQYKLRILENNE